MEEIKSKMEATVTSKEGEIVLFKTSLEFNISKLYDLRYAQYLF